jgi:hypothetical protein
VPSDARWAWRYQATAPDADWVATGYDDSAWPTGVGEFGYGDGDETTVLPVAAKPYPVSAQFRTTFDLAGTDVDALTLRLLRDDGAVVYLNGTEIARSNMPEGQITHTTTASSGFWQRELETKVHEIAVDPGLLVAGQNTLAVQVHQASAYSEDVSFAASLTATRPAPLEAWYGEGFDDSQWSQGAGQLGFGDGDEDTPIDPSSGTGATSAQMRRTFTVPDASLVQDLVLNLVRDDGAVVYVNGVEVARDNMPTGDVTLATPAATAVWGSDERDPRVIHIDPTVLRDGANTLAISVHNDQAAGPDLSLEVVSLDAVG